MFPLQVRSYAASFATAGNWSLNFLLTFFSPFITSAIQFRYGYVFAGCNLLAVIVVFFFYYESSGLNLEQVDSMYCDPEAKPWTSHTWVPKGHTSRRDAAETAKDAEVHGAGVRAETEHLEAPHESGRSSADTRVTEPEKKDEINTVPETNRGKFSV